MDTQSTSLLPTSPFYYLNHDSTSSPPSSPLQELFPPLLDQSRMEKALLASCLSSRPHPLTRSQVDSISHYIVESDYALSLILQIVLEDLVQTTSPLEHSFLMHTFAAAASFYEAKGSCAPCPPQAVEHYAQAIELMSHIHTPCMHLNIMDIVLKNILAMAQAYL
ncbi:hypothetical protein DSO57_1017908 [Entomophthora muscae]|uniref:Uncharacterized protein n=2 Tax=Entomophthora muscae TaxID=34485 RepID=A0ACC2RJ42_9FUNG|nr:hypothetical protein DSO57_1017907 [Entomophthora muscae]KAJ9050072.1 hypothetical protein DSO57_1017908 [Entomophthora muscae]